MFHGSFLFFPDRFHRPLLKALWQIGLPGDGRPRHHRHRHELYDGRILCENGDRHPHLCPDVFPNLSFIQPGREDRRETGHPRHRQDHGTDHRHHRHTNGAHRHQAGFQHQKASIPAGNNGIALSLQSCWDQKKLFSRKIYCNGLCRLTRIWG